MLGTVSVYPAGDDLATLGYKVLQGSGLFVINNQTFVRTETAYLFPDECSFLTGFSGFFASKSHM